MKKRNRCPVTLVVMISITLFSHAAWAHDLWATMEKYTLDKASKASLAVFSSHLFPAGTEDLLPAGRLDKVLFITPTGRQLTASAGTDGTYSSKASLPETGTYLAVAIPRGGFATKTTEGYQQGRSKKGLSNVVECRYSQKFAKSIFAVGKPGGDAVTKPLGHAMEIIPLKDPSTVGTGGELPVKVVVEGKPARTFVYGTYEGFSEKPNTFAYATRTNNEGIAAIKMLHGGIWVLIAKQEEAYPDPAECDKRAWAASLTFEVR